jgi:NADH-quinone oxidoreductase subunit A
MTSNYLAAALMILVGVGFALLLTALAKYIGPRRFNKAKDVPYECGSDVIGSPRARFEVKFYQVAIVFLVFDIETAFLYPWARELGAEVLAVPVSVRHRLLRHGVHVGRGAQVRHRALRRRVPALLAPPG